MMRMKLFQYLRLLRPLQWIKNIFVFGPLFFSNSLLDLELLLKATSTFGAFCFISSSIYCLNDIRDVESDKFHPDKRFRPIASGIVSTKEGYYLLLLCIFLSTMVLFLSNIDNKTFVYVVLFFYLLMNIAYCFNLKQYSIIDVLVISVGFVMRVQVGGLAINVWISHWIILMTFLLSLFMAFAKRYDDYMIFVNTGTLHRFSIMGYNQSFLAEVVSILASIIIVCYIMYTTSDEILARMNTPNLYLTSIWVIVGHVICKICLYIKGLAIQQHC